jgi:hypothetical protein
MVIPEFIAFGGANEQKNEKRSLTEMVTRGWYNSRLMSRIEKANRRINQSVDIGFRSSRVPSIIDYCDFSSAPSSFNQRSFKKMPHPADSLHEVMADLKEGR